MQTYNCVHAMVQVKNTILSSKNINNQIIIRLSKPRTKPRTIRHEARDELLQSPRFSVARQAFKR